VDTHYQFSTKTLLSKEFYLSVPVSKHLKNLYWLRYLRFHRPHLDVDDGFQDYYLTLFFPILSGGRDDFAMLNRNASATYLIQIIPATFCNFFSKLKVNQSPYGFLKKKNGTLCQ